MQLTQKSQRGARRARISAIAATFLVLATTGLIMPGTAEANYPCFPPPKMDCTVVSRVLPAPHGLVLTPTGLNGGIVVASTNTGRGDQHWILSPQTPGEIRNAIYNDQCLNAVDAESGTDGGRVVLWPCNGTAHERWFEAGNPGWGEFANAAHGLCLDVAGGTHDGDHVQVWTCNGGRQQQWFGF